MKNKILFVTHLYYPARGGVEIHIKRLAQGLVEKGYNIKVLTTNAYSTEAFFLNDKRRIEASREIMNGVDIERLGFRTYGKKLLTLLRSLACRIKYPFNEWVRFYSFGPRNPQFLDKILEEKPALIFAAPLPTFNIYYAHKAAKILNLPLIINPAYHIHDPCSYFNSIYFKILRDARLVAVHSKIEKSFLAENGNIPLQQIEVFPPIPFEKEDLCTEYIPVDKEKLKSKFGIGQKSVLLFIGQHGMHKNISGIFKAMRAVWGVEDDVALVIAGGTTTYTPELKITAEVYNQEFGHKIYFIDNFPQDEKDEILDMSDIFISLSEFESFGIVFAEAMKQRLPVLASVNSVARSIVDDLYTGLLVDPKSETEVSGAILKLLQDSETRRRYGENGRKKVLEQYHPDHILDHWDRILSEIIKTRAKR